MIPKTMKQCTLLFIILAVSPLSLEARDSAENKTAISFEQYCQILKNELPELKKSEMEELLAENKINREKKIEDWTLESETKYIIDNTSMSLSGSGDLGGAIDGEINAHSRVHGLQVDTGVSRTFARTGTRLKTGVKFGILDSSYDYDTSPPASLSGHFDETLYQPVIYVGVAQPLLYNSFGLLDRFPEKDAKFESEIEKIRQQQYRKSIQTYYRKLYFDWILYQRIIEILEGTITNTRRIVATVQRHYRSGMADLDDVNKSNLALYTYLDQLNTLKSTFKQISVNIYPYIDTEKYIPDESTFEKYVEKSMARKFSPVPFEETGNWRIYQYSMRRLDMAEKAGRNKTLPRLSLMAQVSKKGMDPEAGAAFGKLFTSSENVDLEVGLMLTYPIGNHEGKADYRESRILKKQLSHEYEISRRKYEQGLSNIGEMAESIKRSLRYKKLNLQALEAKLRTEYRKYNMARLNLTYVLDSENRIAQEKIEILQIRRKLIDLNFDYQDLVY